MINTFLMDKKQLLKTIIADTHTAAIPEVWKRTQDIPIDSGKIIALMGVRRSGKTYHLFEVMNELQATGLVPEKMLYINFEDERLHISGSEMDLLLQAYRELYPDLDLSECYFFFDEIQEVEGWEQFVDRLYRSVSPHVFVTGSNSKLLSTEIASVLRGRALTFEVYPLSFSEYAQIVSPGLKPNSSADRARLVNLFEGFLHNGGFPEIVKLDASLHERLLQGYFNVMLLHDLIERYKISQVAVLKYFCKRVIGAAAGAFSVNKVYKDLISQGNKIGKDTLYEFQGYVEDVYLSRFIPKYDESVVKAEGSQKKAYVVDQGLGAALDFKLAQDDGRLLEITVALELIKQGKQLAYYQDNTECDFVVIQKDQVTEALQVSMELSDEQTKTREIKGLVQCCKRFGLEKGTIISFDTEEQLENNGVQVDVIPAWRYFI
jgi:predicted AAA+ superfamily ATPase